MKKGKILRIFAITVFYTIISLTATSTFASTGTITNGSTAGNLFEATGPKGPKTDHTSCTYAIDNEPAWCIDAGVDVVQGEGYNQTRTEDDSGALSWLMYNSSQMGGPIDNQIVQAAVWKLTGNTVTSVGGVMEQVDSVIEQARHCNDGISAPSASINVEGSLELTMDDAMNAYVSPKINVSDSAGNYLEGAPSGSYIQDYNGGYRIVVPATSVSGNLNIRFVATCNSSAQTYGPARVYEKSGSQTLIKPSRGSVSGSAASVNFNLKAVGKGKLGKKDEHEKPIQGAKYWVVGPEWPEGREFITNSNGEFETGYIAIGIYTITETYVPGTLAVAPNPQTIEIKSGYGTQLVSFTNEYKRGSTQLDKYDMDYEKNPKGDCKLGGAIYGVYAANDIKEGETLVFEENEKIIEVTTDDTGKTPVVKNVYSKLVGKELDGLPIGSYYWKELQPSEGFNINPDIIYFDIENDTSDKYKTDLAKVDATQGEKLITGRGLIIKYDNGNKNGEESSEKNASEGAVLRIRLVSAIGTDKEERNTYTATIDENGYCEFKDQEYLALHPGEIYTIPYGRYELTEIKESKYGTHTYYYTQTEYVTISENHQVERRIVADEPLTVHLMLIKKDKVSGMDVHISGGKYKIWDCQKDEFVTQMKTPSGEMIDTFETNELGYFITPQKLYAGEYIVYEIEAPKGYYLDDEYRLPENPEDYGDITKGGAYVKIDKQAVGIAEDTQAPLTGEPDLIYEVEIANRPLKGKIEVEKTGEMLTEYNEYDKIAEFEDGEKMTYKVTTPVYKFKGLANVEYTIEAKEDIKSPDGRYTYEGAHSVKHKIRTDENGYAITDELYLGTYEITETETPLGYVTDTDIDDITLENDNQLERIKTTIKELQNIKQKTELDVEKEFEDSIYDFGKIKVVLGIYTKQDLKANGTDRVVIKQDTLLDVVYGEVEPGETINLTSDVNVPAGTYYVQELYVDYPYELSDKKYEFTVSHKNTIDEKVNIKIPKITNEIIKGSLSVVKLSANSLINEEDQPLVGGKLTEEQIDRNLSDLVNWMRATEPNIIRGFLIDENLEYDDIASTLEKEADKRYMLELASTKLYSGAIYGIYLDKDCKEPLKYKNGTNVVIETNRKGYGEAENMPIGEYWLQEIKAPSIMIGEKEFTYDVDKEIKHVTLPLEDKDKITFNAFCDTIEVGDFLTKYDIFTGELVPDCIFMIQDKDGKIIVEATTNEKGLFELPIEWFEYGETYTYTEIEAPEEYNIDTTPHEFTIEFDENGDLIKVEAENTRKTRKVIVRKLDADTSEPLEGCIFTIALIDEETGEQMVNQRTGEAIYLVENATTDENGEYVIDEAPMGTYRFTEIKAPEGYELDEDLTGYEFTINNDSPETIIFEVTNTGDIAVVAIACIGLVCVVGIVYIMRKRIFVK